MLRIKKLALFSFILALMPIVLANLELNTTNVNINAFLGIEKEYHLQVTNRYNYSLFDINISKVDGITAVPITKLDPNVSSTLILKVKPNEVGEVSEDAEITFKFEIVIPQTPKTHKVNISENGFTPQEITIYQEDSIEWKNIDTITHILSSADFGQDVQLSSQAVYSRQFNVVKTINYQDNVQLFPAKIFVLNRSQVHLANNPQLDKPIILNLDFNLIPTDITLEVIEGSNSTVEFGSTKEGVLRISNTGNEEGLDLTLKDSLGWIVFGEQNFSLSTDETNFVDFTIIPVINESDDSNKTYTIDITLSGSNIADIEREITVFVPFTNVASANITSADWWIARKAHCDAHPSAADCITEPIIQERNVTIIQEPSLPYNFTQTEIAQLFREQRQVVDAIERNGNFILQNNEMIIEITDDVNTTDTRLAKVEDNLNTLTTAIVIIIIFGVLIVGIIFAGKYVKNRKDSNPMQGFNQ